jgi:hypothetical protein
VPGGWPHRPLIFEPEPAIGVKPLPKPQLPHSRRRTRWRPSENGVANSAQTQRNDGLRKTHRTAGGPAYGPLRGPGLSRQTQSMTQLGEHCKVCPRSTHTAPHKSDSSRATFFMKTARCTRALSVILVSQALWTTSTWAQKASPESRQAPQEQFTCQLAGTSDRREIGIYRSSGPQHCRVDYTRDGTTRSLWSSRHDNLFCVRKALEIVGLLESIDFKCSPHTGASGSEPTR